MSTTVAVGKDKIARVVTTGKKAVNAKKKNDDKGTVTTYGEAYIKGYSYSATDPTDPSRKTYITLDGTQMKSLANESAKQAREVAKINKFIPNLDFRNVD